MRAALATAQTVKGRGKRSLPLRPFNKTLVTSARLETLSRARRVRLYESRYAHPKPSEPVHAAASVVKSL